MHFGWGGVNIIVFHCRLRPAIESLHHECRLLSCWWVVPVILSLDHCILIGNLFFVGRLAFVRLILHEPRPRVQSLFRDVVSCDNQSTETVLSV